MKEWWNSLAEREQRLVMMLAPVLLIAVLFFGIWKPVMTGASQTEQQVAAAERELAWMKTQAERVLSAARQPTGAKGSGSLSAIVNQVAAGRSITITRLQPQGDALQVWIDEVSWGDLLGLLETLKRDYGVMVTSADLARTDTEGLVKVRRLELTRG